MFRLKARWLSVFAVLLFTTPAAHAQSAVIDVGSIAQLMQQIITMKEQLDTAKNQLDTARNQFETAKSQLAQAKSEFESMTGTRGMEKLLSNINRNYLPTTWTELDNARRGVAGAYGSIANTIRQVTEVNAILNKAQVERLSPHERMHLEEARRTAATLQVVAREALANSSQRFASIQQLIAAIPTAPDQKAILDLHVRTEAENGALEIEQIKLDSLYQAAQAEELARRQRAREQSIADIGSFKDLPPLGL
jgi:type IV secretion system protein VirB5